MSWNILICDVDVWRGSGKVARALLREASSSAGALIELANNLSPTPSQKPCLCKTLLGVLNLRALHEFPNDRKQSCARDCPRASKVLLNLSAPRFSVFHALCHAFSQRSTIPNSDCRKPRTNGRRCSHKSHKLLQSCRGGGRRGAAGLLDSSDGAPSHEADHDTVRQSRDGAGKTTDERIERPGEWVLSTVLHSC